MCRYHRVIVLTLSSPGLTGGSILSVEKNMRLKFLTLFFSFFVFFKGYAEDITIVTMEWPPFTDSKAPHKGTTTDIIVKAFKSQGVNANVEFTNWTRAMMATEKGEYTAIFPAYYAKERESTFTFQIKLRQLKLVL